MGVWGAQPPSQKKNEIWGRRLKNISGWRWRKKQTTLGGSGGAQPPSQKKKDCWLTYDTESPTGAGEKMGGLGGAAPQPDFFEIIGQNLNNKSGWRQEGKQKTLGGGVWGAHPPGRKMCEIWVASTRSIKKISRRAGRKQILPAQPEIFLRFGMLRPEISNPPSGCAGKITSLPCRPEGFSRFELLQPEISKNLPAAPEAKKSPAQPEVFFIFGLLRSEIQSSFVRLRRKGKKRRSRKRNLRFWLLRPEISFPPRRSREETKTSRRSRRED